jgi:hypothetical protein
VADLLTKTHRQIVPGPRPSNPPARHDGPASSCARSCPDFGRDRISLSRSTPRFEQRNCPTTLFDEAVERYAEKPAFECFGRTMT